jgi:hypothetical protein
MPADCLEFVERPFSVKNHTDAGLLCKKRRPPRKIAKLGLEEGVSVGYAGEFA